MTYKEYVAARIEEKNPLVVESVGKRVMDVCEEIPKLQKKGLFPETYGCEIIGDTSISLSFGTYYADISGKDHMIYDIFSKADRVDFHLADISNPDGAVIIINLVFENLW